MNPAGLIQQELAEKRLDFSPLLKYQKLKQRLFPPPKTDKNQEILNKSINYISGIQNFTKQ